MAFRKWDPIPWVSCWVTWLWPCRAWAAEPGWSQRLQRTVHAAPLRAPQQEAREKTSGQTRKRKVNYSGKNGHLVQICVVMMYHTWYIIIALAIRQCMCSMIFSIDHSQLSRKKKTSETKKDPDAPTLPPFCANFFSACLLHLIYLLSLLLSFSLRSTILNPKLHPSSIPTPSLWVCVVPSPPVPSSFLAVPKLEHWQYKHGINIERMKSGACGRVLNRWHVGEKKGWKRGAWSWQWEQQFNCELIAVYQVPGIYLQWCWHRTSRGEFVPIAFFYQDIYLEIFVLGKKSCIITE